MRCWGRRRRPSPGARGTSSSCFTCAPLEVGCPAMHVLITGAAGFIGSNLAERLRARGDTVIGLDNFDAFYPRAVKERNLARLREDTGFRLVEGDLRTAADVAAA